MHRPHRMAVVLLAAGMFMSGCYGPFLLTRKVWKFNGEVSDNKWVVELVHLVCLALPVYSIATAADGLIFNSIQFWTGSNPMEKADAQGVRATKRIVRKDSETVLKRVASADGDQLVIEQVAAGRPTITLRFQRQGDGMVAVNGDGAVLYSARTRPDGTVVVADARGQQVASYSGDQTQRLLESVPQ